MKNDSEKYIQQALKLAAKGLGHVAPNPMVGAVVVKKGKVIGRGYHKIYGGPHAEVHAINSSKESVRGATLYCSLEPCCHTKKQTPPCTDLVIKSGIKKIVVASLDPNPQVSGRGLKILKKAGIKVEHGFLAEQERKLNEVFYKNMTTDLPFVHAKLAQTLDGKIATSTGDSKWITDEQAREDVHRLRVHYQAILVGSKTVDLDNPFLNRRYGLETKYPWPKVIILGEPKTDERNLNIFSTHRRDNIFIFTNNKLRANETTRFYYSSAKSLLKKLYKLGISSVMVEGGSKIHSFFLEKKCVDKLTIYQSASILGSGLGAFDSREKKLMKQTMPFTIDKVTKINNQIKIDLYPEETL